MDDFSGLDGAALVVGASGGIGRVVAQMLIERGSDVALTWRTNADSVDALVATGAVTASETDHVNAAFASRPGHLMLKTWLKPPVWSMPLPTTSVALIPSYTLLDRMCL